jgi:hypothetical protein
MLLRLLLWVAQLVSQMPIRMPAAQAASAMQGTPGLETRAPRVLLGCTNLPQDLLPVAIAKQASTRNSTVLLTALSVAITRPLNLVVLSVNAWRDTLVWGSAQAA